MTPHGTIPRVLRDKGVRFPWPSDVLSAKHFHDPDEAACRLSWKAFAGQPVPGSPPLRFGRSFLRDKARHQRNGAIVYRCGERECRKDFTVTTKSVMDCLPHQALHKWLQGFYQMSSSKKGMSGHQLHRSLGISTRPRGLWRIASAKRCALAACAPDGSATVGDVEADETYFGQIDAVTRAELKPMNASSPRQQ